MNHPDAEQIRDAVREHYGKVADADAPAAMAWVRWEIVARISRRLISTRPLIPRNLARKAPSSAACYGAHTDVPEIVEVSQKSALNSPD